MQAIIAKYLPATNHKPSRVKASCERGSIVIPHDSGLSDPSPLRFAVAALVLRFAREDAKEYGTPIDKNPWLRPMVCGQIPSGEWVFVFTA